MTKPARKTWDEGFSLVEAILSVSLFALLVTALVGVWVYGEEASRVSGDRSRAVFLAEEGVEALRNMKDGSFGNLAEGVHGLAGAATWSFAGSSDASGQYTRSISVSSPSLHARRATSSVTWQIAPNRVGFVDVASYFSNWQRSWGNATQVGSVNFSGNTDGWRVAVSGEYAYAVRTGGPPDFYTINISDPSLPSEITSLGLSADAGDIAVSGNFAYVASASNTQELQVINISNPATPFIAGTGNAPSSDDGISISVFGNYAYLTRTGAPNFIIFDISNPSAPALLGTTNLSGTPYGTVRVGNYVYVSSSNNSQELQIVDVSNPGAPVQVGSENISGNSDGNTVAVAGNILVVGRDSMQLSVFDLTNPTNPSEIGTSDTGGGTIYDIAIGNGGTYVFLATSNSPEFQVIDIYDPSNPVLVGSINTPSTLYGIEYDPVKDRVYAVSGSNSQEFSVFAPLP